MRAGLQEETEAVSGLGQEEGYAAQSREEDRALPAPGEKPGAQGEG